MQTETDEGPERAPMVDKTIPIGEHQARLRKPDARTCLLITYGLEPNPLIRGLACLAACWLPVHGRPDLRHVDPYNSRQVGEAMLDALLERGVSHEDIKDAARTAALIVYEVPILRPSKIDEARDFSSGQVDSSNGS